MASPTSDSFQLLARLELLDGQVRKLKRTLVFVLGFFGIALLLLVIGLLRTRSQTGEEEKFILRDGNGTVRAALVVSKDVPALEFYDKNHELLGGLMMSGDENSFIFFDGEKRLRGKLGVIEGQPALHLNDANGKRRVELSMTPNGVGLVL